MTIAAAGCAQDVPPDDAAPRTEDGNPEVDDVVMGELEQLGYSTEDVEVDGDVIRVEGDMILSRDGLLRGDYRPSRLSSGDVSEKGYQYANLVSTANAPNIKLVFSGSPYTPTTAIQNAFLNGALQWNGVGTSIARIKTTNTGPSITVKMIAYSSWPGASSCPSSSYACADIPSSGQPGAVIWIRNGFGTSDPCDYTPSLLQTIAVHELGHAIGLAHVKETPPAISGTMSCASTFTNCNTVGATGYYDTVMRAYIGYSPYPSCEVVGGSTISSDDKASIGSIY